MPPAMLFDNQIIACFSKKEKSYVLYILNTKAILMKSSS